MVYLFIMRRPQNDWIFTWFLSLPPKVEGGYVFTHLSDCYLVKKNLRSILIGSVSLFVCYLVKKNLLSILIGSVSLFVCYLAKIIFCQVRRSVWLVNWQMFCFFHKYIDCFRLLVCQLTFSHLQVTIFWKRSSQNFTKWWS